MSSTSTLEKETINGEKHRIATKQLDMKPYTLLGPGPSNTHPRVLQSLSFQQSSHFFTSFWEVLSDVQELLRYVFQTDNEMTFAVSGTGSAAMECAMSSVLEPGDKVVIAHAGYWGERMMHLAERLQLDYVLCKGTFGKAFTLDQLEAAVKDHGAVALLLTHGESSTGVLQSMEGVGEMCHANNCLVFLDSVVTFGGVEVKTDEWGVDVHYSGSQKCLSVPPGVSPITFSPLAVKKMEERKQANTEFYLDAQEIYRYWNPKARVYHHTFSMPLGFALREGLRIIAEDGLEATFARHAEAADELATRLVDELGLELFVEEPKERIGVLTTVRIPEGVDAVAMRKWILEKYNVEIAGGLGNVVDTPVMRIGLMGFNARLSNVELAINVLKAGLKEFGYTGFPQ